MLMVFGVFHQIPQDKPESKRSKFATITLSNSLSPTRWHSQSLFYVEVRNAHCMPEYEEVRVWFSRNPWGSPNKSLWRPWTRPVWARGDRHVQLHSVWLLPQDPATTRWLVLGVCPVQILENSGGGETSSTGQSGGSRPGGHGLCRWGPACNKTA